MGNFSLQNNLAGKYTLLKREREMKMKKRFISLLLSLTMSLALLPTTAFAVSNNGTRFQDVKTTDWFYEAVEYVAQNNMMSGTAVNTFSPNQTTTRGMIVTILHRMEGEPSTTGTTFSDVTKGQWYTNAVAWASANGIVTGYGTGAFGPNDTITREQLATILYRYAQFKSYDISTSSSITSFSDGGKVSNYAAQAMSWAVGSGLISGVGENTLSPQSGATRAQAATILMRFNQEIAGTVGSSNVGMVYSVSDVQAAGKSATVIVNTIDSCTLEVTVLDENETKILFKTSTTVGKNLEISPVAVPLPQALPKYFVVRAVLKNQSGKELCDPYTTIKYTKRYEEFQAKTVDDFEDDIVLNLDSSKNNNFAVLNENAVRVDCTNTSNVCMVNGNVYTFTKTNSQLDGMSSGDVVALFDQGEALTAIVVQNVSNKGDTVTITAERDPSIQELYQYVKIDIEETANSFQKETDPYLAYNPTNSVGGAALRQSSDWRKNLKRDVAANPSVSSKLEQSVELSLGNNTKVEVKTDLTMKYALSLEYDFSWLENTVDFEVTSEISGDVSAKVSAEKKFDSTKNTVETFQLTVKDIDAKLGKYWIPTSLPGVSFTAELSVPVKLNINSSVEIKQDISMTNGVGVHWENGKVTYNTIEDKQNERTLDWKGEGSFSVGAKAAVGVDALSVISADLSGEIGAKAKAAWTKTIWSGNEPESKHLCEKCLSGDVKGYAKAGVKVELGIKGTALSATLVDLTIAEAEFLKRDFYVSVDKFIAGDADYMGWNAKCPNMVYRTKILTKDTTGKELDDVAVSIFPSGETQAEKQDTIGGESVYLCRGDYFATAQSNDGKPYSKEFTVSGKAQEVTVELPAELLPITSEIVVDLYTGMPQIRYYNDKGQIAYCVTLNGTADWERFRLENDPYNDLYNVSINTGYLHEAYVTKFFYDSAGKLIRSSGMEHVYDFYPDDYYGNEYEPLSIFYGNLTYKYENDLIKAYDNSGSFRFAMDNDWNIISGNTFDAEYTYNNRGQITGINLNAPMWYFEVKISYDSNGNITDYNEIEHDIQDNGRIDELTYEHFKKYTYEDGRMTGFTDSDFSSCPWLFSYDSNNQVSGLQVKDLKFGNYSTDHYEKDPSAIPHDHYSSWNYKFEGTQENGTWVPTIQTSIGGDRRINKTFTVPSR